MHEVLCYTGAGNAAPQEPFRIEAESPKLLCIAIPPLRADNSQRVSAES
jgi:hypothetical protein